MSACGCGKPHCETSCILRGNADDSGFVCRRFSYEMFRSTPIAGGTRRDIKLPSRDWRRKGGLIGSNCKILEAIQRINDADHDLDQMLESVNQTVQALPDCWATLTIRIASRCCQTYRAPLSGIPSSRLNGPRSMRLRGFSAQMHQAYDAAELAWENLEPKLRDFLCSPPKRFPSRNRLNELDERRVRAPRPQP